MRPLGIAVACVLVVCSVLLFPLAAFPATHLVEMIGISFVPDTLVITAGDTILWHNSSTATHTTTSGTPGLPDGLWNSGSLGPGLEFSRAFNTAGTFDYYCIPHGSFGMVGQVIVEPNASGVGNGPPPQVTLGQNYPNPFNPMTAIDFVIQRPAFVELEVFDALGRRVRVLVSAFRPAGPYTARFDGRDGDGRPVASGVYVYQLKLGGVAVETKKMVLIK